MITLDPNDTTALRLLSNAADAARCVAIYRSGSAAVRPMAAWELLPLGYAPAETVAILERLEVESASTADIYRHYRAALEALEARAKLAAAAWTAHIEGAKHGNENRTHH